jgi:hypothetical protein
MAASPLQPQGRPLRARYCDPLETLSATTAPVMTAVTRA